MAFCNLQSLLYVSNILYLPPICRDVDITEKLDYSSAIALLGFSLILAIIRVFSVRTEAARVMVAAPLLAFVTTHILYLNFYQFDYGKRIVQIFTFGNIWDDSMTVNILFI